MTNVPSLLCDVENNNYVFSYDQNVVVVLTGTITYLSKFGTFLFMTIGFSLLFALGFYPVLLMLMGPPFCQDKRSHLCCDLRKKAAPAHE